MSSAFGGIRSINILALGGWPSERCMMIAAYLARDLLGLYEEGVMDKPIVVSVIAADYEGSLSEKFDKFKEELEKRFKGLRPDSWASLGLYTYINRQLPNLVISLLPIGLLTDLEELTNISLINFVELCRTALRVIREWRHAVMTLSDEDPKITVVVSGQDGATKKALTLLLPFISHIFGRLHKPVIGEDIPTPIAYVVTGEPNTDHAVTLKLIANESCYRDLFLWLHKEYHAINRVIEAAVIWDMVRRGLVAQPMTNLMRMLNAKGQNKALISAFAYRIDKSFEASRSTDFVKICQHAINLVNDLYNEARSVLTHASVPFDGCSYIVVVLTCLKDKYDTTVANELTRRLVSHLANFIDRSIRRAGQRMRRVCVNIIPEEEYHAGLHFIHIGLKNSYVSEVAEKANMLTDAMKDEYNKAFRAAQQTGILIPLLSDDEPAGSGQATESSQRRRSAESGSDAPPMNTSVRILAAGGRSLAPQHPFSIPVERFRNASLDEVLKLRSMAYELCREEIERAFEDPEVLEVLVCDGRVVMKSKEPITAKEIMGKMEELGKPCYVFAREILTEEGSSSSPSRPEHFAVGTSWCKISGEDYYPTIRVFLGNPYWDDELVASEGRAIIADLDTGNPSTIFLNEEIAEDIGIPIRPNFAVREGVHLGRKYLGWSEHVKIAILDDETGESRVERMPVIFVKDFGKSPFVLANRFRIALAGRKLMAKFKAKLTLDFTWKRTLIRLPSREA